ncbi:MAG: hypothetical protein RMK89_13950, partial [Armatimonadota bacterium]|nr:hypothetical protein [Armatimonadota bacterium]MDW8144548.1 hypothetical protein [Armatimonadota bacterium]
MEQLAENSKFKPTSSICETIVSVGQEPSHQDKDALISIRQKPYLSVCLSARLADAYISEFRLGRKITFLKCLASVPMLQALTFWFCIRRIGEFPS